MKISARASSLLAVLALMVAANFSYALPPEKVDFSNLNLVGLQILEAKSGENSFAYKLKDAKITDAKLLKTLETESASRIVSPIYDLDEKSAFKNIYVYVGQTEEGTFELVTAMHNSSGSFFVVDMDIVDVEKNEMTLHHGPPDERLVYKASVKSGSLLP